MVNRHAGRYTENRCLYSALLTQHLRGRRYRLVLNADAQWSPFSPGFTAPMNRRRLARSAGANLAEPGVFRWLRNGLRRLAPGRFYYQRVE